MVFLMFFLFIVSGNYSNINADSNSPNRTILIQLKINEKEFDTLKEMKIEFASKFIEDGSFAIVSQAELSFLNERNFKFKKIKQSKNKLDLYKRALYGKTMKLDPIYFTYEEIIQNLNRYVKKYPNLVLIRKIGETSELKKDIFAVKISKNVHDEEDEPAILFNGGVHSCELAGVEICLTLIDYLLLNYGKNERVTGWVNKNEIWFIPVVNVDGHHVVNITKWYSDGSVIRGNLMYYDDDYLYAAYYYRGDTMWKFDPILKLKRKIAVGETIGDDFDLKQDDKVMHYTYSRTLLSVEDVTTPAGEFHDCLKFLKLMGGGETYEWWAPNVGVVKATGALQYEVISYNFTGTNNNSANCPPAKESTFNMESYILHIPVLSIEGYDGAKYELDLKFSGTGFELINIQAIDN